MADYPNLTDDVSIADGDSGGVMRMMSGSILPHFVVSIADGDSGGVMHSMYLLYLFSTYVSIADGDSGGVMRQNQRRI